MTVFNNVVVTASGAPVDTWTYTTPRFWDTNYDSYTFYAVSPSGAATMAPQTGVIAETSKTFSGDDNDILVADKVTVAKGSTPYFNNYATVDLTFKHAATLVDVKVKKTNALANNDVTIKAFALNNIASEGTFAVSGYTGTTPTITWKSTANNNYGPGDGVVPVSISPAIEIALDNTFDSSNADPDKVPAGSTTLINNLVVMPQAISAQTITLTYNIEGDDADHAVTLNIADFDKVDNDDQEHDAKVGNWVAGKHYIYYITIDAKAIVFSASISEWESVTVNGYHYILN